MACRGSPLDRLVGTVPLHDRDAAASPGGRCLRPSQLECPADPHRDLLPRSSVAVACLQIARFLRHLCSLLAANHLADRVERDDADWNPSLERAAELSGVFPVQAENLIAQAAETAPKTPPVSFDLHAGECLQIIGRSGTGKTTLAEIEQLAKNKAIGVVNSYRATDKFILISTIFQLLLIG